MVVSLVTQSIVILVLVLVPWPWLCNVMQLQMIDYADHAQCVFRIYVLLIPVLHLILAAGIEVKIHLYCRVKERK